MSRVARDLLAIILLLYVLSFVGLVVAQPINSEVAAPVYDLVYTRQPRHQTPVGPMDDAANWQHVNDISRVWDQSEADVVRDQGGRITMIHDCTGSPEVCTAQEIRVSPDKTQAIYSLSVGAKLDQVVKANGYDTGLRDFRTITAELWLYDFATGKKRRLSSGHIDRSPSWCGNDCIVFASDRAGTFAPRSTLGRNFYTRPAFQIHRARITDAGLADVVNITPAEHFAMNPEITTWGGVVYSSWQGVAPREFGSTPQNHWWICEVDINGGNPRCLLGAHGSGNIENYRLIADWADPARRGEGATVIRGLRVIAELWPGYLAVMNYYRGNWPSGKIFGFQYGDAEGASLEKNIPAVTHWAKAGEPASGRYFPTSFLSMTPGGLDQDAAPIFHKDGRAAGRAGYPFPIPRSWGFGPDAWGYTRTRGYGYEAAPAHMATVKAMGGEPTAKKQLDIALVRQVKNPFDPAQNRVLACASLDYHCWDARAVATYKDLYGIAAPAIAPIKMAEACALRVVNARLSELQPAPPPPGATPEKLQELRVAFQGNADPAYPALVDAVGVEYFDHWKVIPSREGLAQSYPPVKEQILSDGSVKIPVECGRPFLHFGYDKAGKKVAHGLAPMAAMGNMDCHGCHDGHSEERMKDLGGKSATERLNDVAAGC